MKIALLHYAYVPVIGGVEFVMEQHANLFARRGHEVKVICGSGAAGKGSEVRVTEMPELLPSHPDCVAAHRSLAGDHGAFETLQAHFLSRFREELAGIDVVFVHNVMTMHFNLAATAALAELAVEGGAGTGAGLRMVNWIHDLAAINPDFGLDDKLGEFPWNLLTQATPGFENAIISPKRQQQYCKLTGIKPKACPVFPNGVEYLRLFKLTKPVRELVRRHGLLHRDIVIIHPTRIVRRKNIEYGIRVLAELKKTGRRCLYLVTGAPDPHNEESNAYGTELRALISELGVEKEFLFVSEKFKVRDADLIGLYTVSDLLFLPSKQEGFGLPLLEAGMFRMPVFCPRLEPMQSILKHNVSLFDLGEEPAAVASQVIQVLNNNRGYQARKEVITHYSWERLFDKIIGPAFLGENRELS
jgi:glycosyltransferase involved in cell wall biosynthesis